MSGAVDAYRLLLTGGGTGGHLFPAVAAAEEFCRQKPGTQVLFVGTSRKVDRVGLAAYGYAGDSITCYGVKGKNPVDLLKALAVLPLSLFQAARILRRFRPHVVLGVGGYVTGPVVVMAKALGIPTLIHEQNSVPGLANRQLGRFADRVCLSLPDSGDAFPEHKRVFTGNPVRRAILDLAGAAAREALPSKTVLVLGGSQGAQAINRLVPEAVQALPEKLRRSLRLIHQTGAADCAVVSERYREIGMAAEVAPFFTDMAAVYARADLLVSRAGATTLAELAVLGKPALLIPYPLAADNHQEKNAEHYVRGGGAVLLRQRELNGEQLARAMGEVLADEARLMDMAQAMRRLALPDAAEKIVACCLELIHRRV
jgi:UDP-N-acetylglucosamine--N-acetylmuramyl-(pentapeptide) pyrophosphoryl-undecaprenol N-acetylglucosamine transferase